MNYLLIYYLPEIFFIGKDQKKKFNKKVVLVLLFQIFIISIIFALIAINSITLTAKRTDLIKRILNIVAVLTGAISPIIVIFGNSFLAFVVSYLMKIQIKIKEIVPYSIIAYVPVLFGQVYNVIATKVNGPSKTGYLVLSNYFSSNGILNVILSQIDLFSIWGILILSFCVLRFSGRKKYLICFYLFAYLLLTIGSGLIGYQVMPHK